ncbi:hypothetical protein Bbelb_248250 [Branchiostoma belcheri]|nr:hypothetical protein Bbelb_248250 [Branchiostoma belcheri]
MGRFVSLLVGMLTVVFILQLPAAECGFLQLQQRYLSKMIEHVERGGGEGQSEFLRDVAPTSEPDGPEGVSAESVTGWPWAHDILEGSVLDWYWYGRRRSSDTQPHRQ